MLPNRSRLLVPTRPCTVKQWCLCLKTLSECQKRYNSISIFKRTMESLLYAHQDKHLRNFHVFGAENLRMWWSLNEIQARICPKFQKCITYFWHSSYETYIWKGTYAIYIWNDSYLTYIWNDSYTKYVWNGSYATALSGKILIWLMSRMVLMQNMSRMIVMWHMSGMIVMWHMSGMIVMWHMSEIALVRNMSGMIVMEIY